MRCNNCGKTVPNTTVNCPYCTKQIDPNQLYVDSSIIEKTPIANTPKEKIIEFAKKKENRMIVIGFGAVAALLVIIILIGIISLFTKGNKVDSTIVNKFMSDTYDHLTETFMPSSGNQGKFSLTASVNENQIHYEGDYDLKLLDRYFYIKAAKNDNSSGDEIIISEDDNFSFETYLLNNRLFINSKDFYNNELYFELPDKDNFLSANKVNVKTLTNGIYETFEEIIKDMNPNSSKTNIDILGKKTKVYRLSYEFDKKTKLDIIKKATKSIKENSSFINEYAKMKGKSKEDIINMIDAYSTTLTYKVKNGNAESSYFNVYATSSSVKRIEVIINTEEKDKYSFELTIGNNTDCIKVKKNKDEIIDLSVTKTDKELSNGIHKTLSFKFKGFNTNANGNLVLDTVNHPNVRKHQASENAVNGYNLSPEDKSNIGNNTYSLTRYDWFNPLLEYVKPICSSELNCTCNDETGECSCNQGTTFVKCLKSEIAKKEE